MSLIVDAAGHSDDIEEENNILRQQLQVLFNQVLVLTAQQQQQQQQQHPGNLSTPDHSPRNGHNSDSQVMLDQKALIATLSREKDLLIEKCQSLQDLVAKLESAATESLRREEENKMLQEQLRKQLQALSLERSALASDHATATDQVNLLTAQLHRAAGEVSSYKSKCESQSLEIVRLKGALESRARLQIPTIALEGPGDTRPTATPSHVVSHEILAGEMDEVDQACGCGRLPWRVRAETKPPPYNPNGRRMGSHR